MQLKVKIKFHILFSKEIAFSMIEIVVMRIKARDLNVINREARHYSHFQSSKFLWIAPNRLALTIGIFLESEKIKFFISGSI